MKNLIIKTSKFLSYVLRHNPEEIGVELDKNGWLSINQLIKQANNQGHSINRELLDEVVQTNDKQRFAISEDGNMIRANQGHSVEVDLALSPLMPPDMLLHGTAEKWIESINTDGLKKMSRHHVHLTENNKIASAVGTRYGKLVMLEVDAKQMVEDGFEFYRSANAVWLVDFVPVKYLTQI